jgi:hypothetical protein
VARSIVHACSDLHVGESGLERSGGVVNSIMTAANQDPAGDSAAVLVSALTPGCRVNLLRSDERLSDKMRLLHRQRRYTATSTQRACPPKATPITAPCFTVFGVGDEGGSKQLCGAWRGSCSMCFLLLARPLR